GFTSLNFGLDDGRNHPESRLDLSSTTSAEQQRRAHVQIPGLDPVTGRPLFGTKLERESRGQGDLGILRGNDSFGRASGALGEVYGGSSASRSTLGPSSTALGRKNLTRHGFSDLIYS
ncbi:unnamed protein product, partial [Amoebophrya sp. A25]